MSDSILRIGLVYPQVLGTYGDSGNAVILAQRALRRGIPAEIVTVGLTDEIPGELDIYALGGGEDTAQAIAAQKMRAQTGLNRAAAARKPVLAICASLQVLGRTYTDGANRVVEGLGLLDAVTAPRGRRAIGELVEEPLLEGLTDLLTGFENHGGGTTLGADAKPLGRVLVGVGNGGAPPSNQDGEEQKYEGAVQGSIIGTYLHGPALARNPQLADYLLAGALGIPLADLPELQVAGVARLRRERLSATDVRGGAK